MGKLRGIVADMLIQEEHPQRFGRVLRRCRWRSRR
jgi:hypothetical protein